MPTVIYDNYEWDSNKNEANKKKHSLSFEAAIQIFKGIIIESPSKSEHSEKRIIAIGRLEGKEIVVIYANRGRRKRVISARRARKNERDTYRQICQENE